MSYHLSFDLISVLTIRNTKMEVATTTILTTINISPIPDGSAEKYPTDSSPMQTKDITIINFSICFIN